MEEKTTKEISSSNVVVGEEASPVYCSLDEREKIGAITIASMITFLSPVTGNIYFPALGPLADDLHVSKTTINLTITVYMIVQGLTPLLTGSLSDRNGRRPVFIACLTLYIGVNIGLCRQTSIAALFALRCLQSVGSSGVSVVATATIADVITRAQRGKYMAYATLGFTLGPAVGPVLGGVLTQFLGWRSIFVFLAIVAAVLILAVLTFMPETCRACVGNGSIRVPGWNRSALQALRRRDETTPAEDRRTLLKIRRRPSLLDSLRITRQRATALLLLGSTALSGGAMAILASLPALLEAHYRFNALQVGLCYLPYGIGGLAARWTMAPLADRNFQRLARAADISLPRNKQTPEQLRAMPLEKARLQLTLPQVCVSAALVAVYGWVMQAGVHVAGPLVLLFFMGNVITGTRNTLATLIVDLHAHRPATATAAMAFFRSLTGAGIVAGVLPLIQAMGVGWTTTLVAIVWIMVVSPALGVVYYYGHGWRRAQDVC